MTLRAQDVEPDVFGEGMVVSRFEPHKVVFGVASGAVRVG